MLTSRRSIKPENLGLGCQVLWCLFHTQDLMRVIQSGLKEPHLVEQMMYGILKRCILIDTNKYSAENNVSNNHRI